ALEILGKNNTKLRQPEVRIIIWPAKDRHTDSQLRALWKFYYKSCWQFAPYAFNSDLKPYAEFEWVTSPTSFRCLARDASQTIARQPPTATNSVVSTVKHTKLPQDNRRSGPAIASCRTPSQHEAGQVRMPYSPTPGPSSHGARPDAKPATNIRSPSEGGTKTPGPPDGKKGTASAEPARAGKSKADDPDVKVEPSASDTQLDPVLKKKKKPRIRDSVDPVVKVEEPAMQLSQLPKKKKKPRTRDSEGSWYDPIAVD
ncbi:hypothetical protein KCU60_g14859, partial [Aureobasidium melanogenum]